jgi:ketosteroid isomerase-like protein
MSQENVEIVRRWAETYNARDIEGLIALSSPDIEFRSIFAAIESGGVFRGYPGVVDYFKALDGAYERFTITPHDLLDAGAAVVLVGEAEWCGKESGAAGTTAIFPGFWLRAGKVFRAETFTDRAAALEAVGLRE